MILSCLKICASLNQLARFLPRGQKCVCVFIFEGVHFKVQHILCLMLLATPGLFVSLQCTVPTVKQDYIDRAWKRVHC